MKQTQLQLGADTIAVYESRGSGAGIVLLHGNSADAETFTRQLEGDFGDSYRVVALDLPGHGKSSPSADPEKTYSLGAMPASWWKCCGAYSWCGRLSSAGALAAT